ncbi:FecR family protein [Sinomicrobium weinanense]|uniref:DUF4974 domain-containing protein n=1 Tax=Sinomicrobium weinanense TaxID=2842200 RepID=A0A926JS17_9FLAO|nr:FecR domain-containing protein [Sinomicrobium weinanense]MBC9796259.1 DUF4974 domain-containing protein [Sinomicrobium weinanense]MBU3122286.1 DUF4974 domain-containing protein [Sinomicrobium weinanense]
MIDIEIILKKINNNLTPEEAVIFNTWYEESEEHRTYFEYVAENYGRQEEKIDWEPAYEKWSKNLPEVKNQRLPYWKFAAAAAVIAVSLLVFYNNDETTPDTPEVTESASIEAGSHKAVLTLEDGSAIDLEEGKDYKNSSAHSNGQSLVYNHNPDTTDQPRHNTLTIPRGGEFELTLADGTRVWLNSESQLKYPVSFSGSKPRTVELIYGEAYFEVSPSTQHNGTSFKVNTSGQEVEVLGTEFNIRAYREEKEIATTLVEGSIVLGVDHIRRELTPGDQSVYNKKDHSVNISPVNVRDEISWKEGLFSFKNKPLKEIVKVLSRWYDVDIRIENPEAGNIKFNGVFNKKQDLENILLIIENTDEAKFETIGKTIIMK